MGSQKEKIITEQENEEKKENFSPFPSKKKVYSSITYCVFLLTTLDLATGHKSYYYKVCTWECRAYKAEQNWLKWRVSEWQCFKKFFFKFFFNMIELQENMEKWFFMRH